MDLEGEPGLGCAVTPLGSAGGLVGEDPQALELVGRYVVCGGLQDARVVGCRHPVAPIGPTIQEGPEVHGRYGAIPLHPSPDPHEDWMAASVGVEHLLPREGDLHRPARDHGQLRHGHLVVEDVTLPAEAAAYGGGYHAYATHGEAQDLRGHPVEVVGGLGARPEGELPLRLPLGHGGVLLDGQVVGALEEEGILSDEVGLLEPPLDITELQGDDLVDVPPQLEVVDGLALLVKGLVDGHVRGQRLIVHLDELRGPLGCGLIYRCDGGDRVADVSDPLGAEGLLILADGQDAVLLGQISAGDYCLDPWQGPGFGGVYGAYPGMGQRGA